MSLSFIYIAMHLTICAQHAPTVEDLIQNLRSKDEAVRLKSLTEMERLGEKLPTEAVAEVISALNDPVFEVRIHAIRLLGTAKVATDKAIASLIVALDSDFNTSLSWEVEKVLINIGKPAVNPIVELTKNHKVSNCKFALFAMLGAIGPDAKNAVPLLEENLMSKNVNEQLVVASAIVRIAPDSKIVKDILTGALTSSELRIRLRAAESLARSTSLKTKDAMDALLEIFVDDVPIDDHLRAAIALGRFGPAGKEALPALTKQFESLRNRFPEIAVVYAGVIVKIDSKNNDAQSYLMSNRRQIQEMARPTNDSDRIDFAKGLLADMANKSPP